jgi:DNA-binding response OmpR family regulator
MTQAPDAADGKGDGGVGAVCILVADADCALYGLLEEWLAGTGYELAGACAPDEPAHDGYDLIVVDVPFPRADVDVLNTLRQAHPGTPIIALSSSFFPGVEKTGAVARELGVAAVLAKPLTREALLAAAQRLLKSGR